MGSKIVAAVEAGTEKISVLVGEIHDPGSLNILTQVTRPSSGIRKGQIVNFEQAAASIEEGLAFAEAEAGARIQTVYLSQSGGHLDGVFQNGTAAVSGADGLVGEDDARRAVDEAKRRKLPENRLYIHHIQNPFRLDGEVVENPIGLRGSELEAGYWSIHGDARRVGDGIHIINGFGLGVSDVIVSSVASGCIVADEDRRRAGCLVLDIGAGTTDYVLYRNGFIVSTGVVAVGGEHFANDLSIGLRLNHRRAKEIFHELGRAVVLPSDETERIRLYGDNMIGDRSIPRSSIDRIVEVRLQEIFQIVREKLGQKYLGKPLPGGVILTGGVSRLRRIETVAAQIFGEDAELAVAPDWVDPSLHGPEFSTVLGVLHFALTGQTELVSGEGRKGKGLFRKLLKI